MSTEMLNPQNLRKLGLEALSSALGPVGMVRFLQQFESGTGDYTKERSAWLCNQDVKSLLKEIKDKRKTK